jgi:hypothetical protein
MSDYKLVFLFPDQSLSFANGFACGRIWERMAESDKPITEIMLAENRDTIEAMAMAKGWDEKIVILDEHWIEVTLTNASFKWESGK